MILKIGSIHIEFSQITHLLYGIVLLGKTVGVYAPGEVSVVDFFQPLEDAKIDWLRILGQTGRDCINKE